MAIIAVKHFIDKIYSDQEYMSSIERYRNHPYEEKLDLSVSKGRELGYDFTREEFREVDQIKKFWEKMDGDEALRQKVAGAQAASPEETVANIVSIAEAEGFLFSAENLVALSEIQMKEDFDGELSDADLEVATGGATSLSSPAFKSTADLAVSLSSNRIRRPPRESTIMCPW